MPFIGYSNSLSLIAQRGLNQAANALTVTAERLSSGMRINNPSDDAAGLAISATLNAQSRVFSQALLNLNDGISAVSMAEGSLMEQERILERLRELALQAANGVFSFTQRLAMHQEARGLSDEFNRLIAGTAFNGIKLIDGSAGNASLQAGFSSIEMKIGEELKRTVGTGAFSYSFSDAFSWSGKARGLESADVNNDSIPDLISIGDSSSDVAVLRVATGKGDGTLNALVNTYLGSTSTSDGMALALADLNGDGYLDIVTAGKNDSYQAEFNVFFNDGQGATGNFSTRVSYAVCDGSIDSLRLADMNGDGQLDIVAGVYDSNELYTTASIFYNQGGGAFSKTASVSLDIGIGSGWLHSLAVGDFNNDGRPDIAGAGDVSSGQAWFYTRLNLGGGSFSAIVSQQLGTTASSSAYRVEVGDLDGDGNLDIVVGGENDSGAGEVNVIKGLGGGSFAERVSYSTGSAANSIVYSARLYDLNGDGILDILTSGTSDGGISQVNAFLGLGNGSFSGSQSVTKSGSNTARDIVAADFDLNGVPDFIMADSVGIHAYKANTAQVTTIPRLDLTSASSALAAISTIDQGLERVQKELGSLGAMQARLKHTVEHLAATRENYLTASARISDVDMAEETAQYVRQQILSQLGAALMAQANQGSELLLQLLE